MRRLPPLLVPVVLLAGTPALAFDDEVQLGVDLAYVQDLGDEDQAPGGAAALRIRYGLNDAVGLFFWASWAGQAVPAQDGEADILRNAVTHVAGVIYALDVFRIVPYLGLGAGVELERFDPTSVAFALHVCGGFDWLWNRSVSTGIEVAYELLIGADVLPARLFASVRVSWHIPT